LALPAATAPEVRFMVTSIALRIAWARSAALARVAAALARRVHARLPALRHESGLRALTFEGSATWAKLASGGSL
jgi:hypothetical protein